MSKAKLGDVIAVDRFGYQHFGVFSGNNKVVHYHKAEDGRGTVMETSMSEFLDGATNFSVFEYSPEIHTKILKLMTTPTNLFIVGTVLYTLAKTACIKYYSPEETVRRARSKIGETKYFLPTNNCEHFAVWYKTGIKDSSQVNNFISKFFGRF